jgi:RNA polymerase sigma-70 factor (ECF subfamily)
VANGAPGFAHYKRSPQGGYEPWALHVLEVSAGCVVGITNFLDTRLFAQFGLPDQPPSDPPVENVQPMPGPAG